MKLKEAREHSGLTVRQVVAATGVGLPNLWRIETGRVKPSIETVVKISGGLGLDAWDIDEFRPVVERAEAIGLVVRVSGTAAQSKPTSDR